MPATAIGIDVDHYKDKLGADTMREAMRRWGPLPVGAHSSARGDGSAGIWFFRVPKGATLKTRIAFPELRLGHVEIIQRHHRYACVWPSVHPETGQRYEWYGLGQTDLASLGWWTCRRCRKAGWTGWPARTRPECRRPTRQR
jgi:hypothetical protein